MLNPNFIYLTVVLNLVGIASYVWATIKGRARPNRVSFLLWAVAPLIAFAAELGKGVGIQSLMTFMVGFGPAVVFVASFVNKKAVWQLKKFDYVCGALSLAGLSLWLITGEGNTAIFFAIMADGLAAVPTVVKSFIEPESESPWVFGLSAISAGITMLTIERWDFAHYGFPIYILLICLLLFVLIQFKLGKHISLRLEARGQK